MVGFTKVRPPTAVAGGWQLRPASGRIVGAAVMGAITLFWNGMVWFMLFQSLKGGLMIASISVLVLGIFALVGVGLAAFFVMALLKALFTPVPTLELAHETIDPLKTTAVRWSFSGNRPLLDLRISLVLREECQYRRGTDTVTDRHEIRDLTLFEHPEPGREGTVTVTIPAGLPPSFAAKNNQLLWCLRLRANVPKLPAVDDEFPVVVRPATVQVAAIVASPLPAGVVLPADTPALALSGHATPGSPVAGIVHLPGKTVHLRLRWSTSGKGENENAHLGDTPIHGGVSGFFVTLPSLPPAWSGTVLSITWHLEAFDGKTVLATLPLPLPLPLPLSPQVVNTGDAPG